MCQAHTGACVSLVAPGKTDYTACHPKKTTTYIFHVVSITTHTHDRRESIGEKKQTKDEGKERKEKKANKKKRKKERKGKKCQEKQEKTLQEEEARKGKEKTNVIIPETLGTD